MKWMIVFAVSLESECVWCVCVLPMILRMLSAISVGVTVPCLVSVCRISNIDSSLSRVLF